MKIKKVAYLAPRPSLPESFLFLLLFTILLT